MITVATSAGRGTAERGRGPCQAGEGPGGHAVNCQHIVTILEIQVVAAVGISSGRLLVAKVQVASMRRCGGIAFANGLGYLDAWSTWDACLRLDGIPFDKLDMS